MTGDLNSAQRFYGAVLGWTFRRTRLGEWFKAGRVASAPMPVGRPQRRP
ncbi:hypothetical protein [Streptomyces nojiriensis]